ADLPGFSSQFSSDWPAPCSEAPFRRFSAWSMWQMVVANTDLASAAPILMEQARWAFWFDTQPGSSAAHEVSPASLQSKCWPGAGGTACPTPAVNKMLPMANPRVHFMLPSPFQAALARPARKHGAFLCRFSAAGRSLQGRANPGPVTRLRTRWPLEQSATDAP